MSYTETFEKDLKEIESLISTPNLIRDSTLATLRDVNLSVLKNTDRQKVYNMMQSLDNISESSFKKSFDVIYNQVCILAVSLLSATLERYFVNYASSNWDTLKFKNDIKLGIQEIVDYNYELKPVIGKIILKKDSSINFQDLKSILRTFEEYLGKKVVPSDSVANHIVFYQQCRHVLVHKSGIVDSDFIKKISGVLNIKNYKVGDKIKLNDQDWDNIKKSFKDLIVLLTGKLR